MTSGPAGYREMGVGTLSFCNELGLTNGAVRMARRPETKKATLKQMLRAEVAAALSQRPDLRVVKLADGAPDNWEFLEKELPEGVSVLDFWHVCSYLSNALDAAYGENSTKKRARFESLRWTLQDDPDGAEKVIRALAYLAKKNPKKSAIKTALRYFRKHRQKMRYRDFVDDGIPIGSGLVEAACKTLVTQRLKRSGMAWSDEGAQAILTPRAWGQSQRFDDAWALLAARYRTDVHVLRPVDDGPRRSNVIPFPRPKVSG